MKISTSTGNIAQAGRGAGKRPIGARTSREEDAPTDDGDANSGLPSLAAFGDRTPPRGTFINILA